VIQFSANVVPEAQLCVGIEFSAGRCEVWTRPNGIQASIAPRLQLALSCFIQADGQKCVQFQRNRHEIATSP